MSSVSIKERKRFSKNQFVFGATTSNKDHSILYTLAHLVQIQTYTMIMKVTLAFLLCLVTLTIAAPSPAAEQVHGAAVIENQPVDDAAIESAEFAQPFEANDAMDTSATHHKRYYYPNAYYYPHYYPRYYPNYHYPGYYNHYY